MGKDGDIVGTGPYFGVGLDPQAGKLSPFKLKEGKFASGPGQVVIDAGTADREGYAVGDTISIQPRGPERKVEVSGIGTFGDVDSIGTATFALFDLQAAQTLFDKQGRYTEILVGGPDSVRTQLSESLGSSLQVQTAADHDRFTLDGLKTFVKFLKVLLLVFGGIAVFVGAFTIYNTLSITVAQRSRELALLRALGATRRQVLRSVVLEALAIGTVASVIGLVAGIGLAKLLNGVFASAGVDLPSTDTVFGARTIIVSLAVGIVVTVVAALGPALRATRVSPVTAMREGTDIPAGRIGRRAPLFAAHHRCARPHRARARPVRSGHRRGGSPGAARARRAPAVHRGGADLAPARASPRGQRWAGRVSGSRAWQAGSPVATPCATRAAPRPRPPRS